MAYKFLYSISRELCCKWRWIKLTNAARAKTLEKNLLFVFNFNCENLPEICRISFQQIHFSSEFWFNWNFVRNFFLSSWNITFKSTAMEKLFTENGKFKNKWKAIPLRSSAKPKTQTTWKIVWIDFPQCCQCVPVEFQCHFWHMLLSCIHMCMRPWMCGKRGALGK